MIRTSTPNLSTSTLFYSRKLSSYNLSVYSLGDNKGSCFLWCEVDGGRGANEIGSCMFKYISSLPETVSDIILYSDACGGQNRNRFFCTAMIYCMYANPHIKSISHKFMESGHSEMEVDSIHAAVETRKKTIPVNIPDNWKIVCAMARKRDPYAVIPLANNEIIDFHTMSKGVEFNLNAIKWRELKWLAINRIEEDDMV